jgi:magnesium chelatase accessory protein
VQVAGAGPHLLLLHGTGASTHSLRGLIPRLAQLFTVVAPDLPGHGFTSMPTNEGFTLPGMAESVGALTRELGISPVLVAGHSAGAAVLIRATLDGRISPAAIVSINGALLPFDSAVGQIFSPVAKMMALTPLVHQLMSWRAESLSAVDRVLRGTGSIPSPEDVGLYASLFKDPGHVAAALGMMANWNLKSLVKDLPKLAVPLILVVGNNDRAIPPRDAARVRALVALARIVWVRGAGHLAHEEKPREIADIIVRGAAEASLLFASDDRRARSV